MADCVLVNLSAEHSVIGGLLLNNDAIDACSGLSADMFADVVNRTVYQAISAMLAENITVDVVSLHARLVADGKQVGGLPFLTELQMNTPSAANIGRYVAIMQDCYARRCLQAVGVNISALAVSDVGDTANTLQAKAIELLGAMVDGVSMPSDALLAHDALSAWREEMRVLDNLPPNALLGLPTGLSKLDGITRGFRRGELVVVGGRPSMGKSCLAEATARACAKAGYGVRLQSYEMPAKDVMARSVCAQMGVDYGRMRANRLQADEYHSLTRFDDAVQKYNWVIDTENAKIDRLCALATAQKRKRGLDCLVIDHLHLMPILNKNPVTELGEISGKLKRLAVALDIVVVLVAQLNRASTQRNEPMMADLRASGAIEQDADMVILAHRPSYYDDKQNPTLAQLIVAKYRHGERQTIECGWQGQHQRFINEPFDWVEPEPIKKTKVAML